MNRWASTRLATLTSLVLAGSGCGAANLVVQNNVTIVIVPAMDPVPFDPQAARLRQATAELFAVIGHAVELRFDQALVPPFENAFADELTTSLESISRELLAMKHHEPEVFAREVPRLTRIETRYRATLTGDGWNEVRFAGGVVSIGEAASSRRLADGHDVVKALDVAYLEAAEARFANRTPEQIAPADRADYVTYVLASPGGRSDEKTDPRAVEILRLTRLAALVGSSDPALAARLRATLVEDYVTSIASEDAPRPGSPEATPGSIQLRAREAWVAWLGTALSSLTPEQRLKIANRIYGRSTPLPGFDDFAFGVGEVDEWVAAGRPAEGTHAEPRDARRELIDRVVCPVSYQPDGDLGRNQSCTSGWVEHALLTEEGTRRMADLLGKRDDTRLVDAVLHSVAYHEQPRTRIWRALEPYPTMFSWATRTLVERVNERPVIHDEAANDLWRDHREYRGVALYILADNHTDRAERSRQILDADSFFRGFARRYGQAIDADAFARFLDLGPGPFALTAPLWLGLGSGWSRSAVLGAHLDRLFDDPLPSSPEYGTPEVALANIVKRMCVDHEVAELGRLHALLVSRAHAHPDNARLLENVLVDSEPFRCAAPPPRGQEPGHPTGRKSGLENAAQWDGIPQR